MAWGPADSDPTTAVAGGTDASRTVAVKMEEEPPTKPDLVPAIGQQVPTLDTDWRSPIIDFIKNNRIYAKGKEHKKLAR